MRPFRDGLFRRARAEACDDPDLAPSAYRGPNAARPWTWRRARQNLLWAYAFGLLFLLLALPGVGEGVPTPAWRIGHLVVLAVAYLLAAWIADTSLRTRWAYAARRGYGRDGAAGCPGGTRTGTGVIEPGPAERAIRVLIADDQAIIREALAALLGLEDDLDVVALAGDPCAAVALTLQHRPDVVLMDVQMPGSADVPDGIAATERITRATAYPRVIILTTFGRPGYLRRAMEAGAVGFLVKDAPADRLVEAIRRVASGLRVVDPALAADSLSLGASPLTARETEVLAAAARGGSTGSIARAAFLSEGTVRNHLSSAMGKLGAGTRAEAVRIATDNGWLD